MSNKWFDDNIDEEIASAIIRLEIKLSKNKRVHRDFRPDVAIDYDRLEEQLEEIPSSFAFWSVVLAEQRAIVAIIERKAKSRKSALTQNLLDNAKISGVKIAQWQVDSLTEADDELIGYEAELILVNRTLSKLFAIVDALRMKSESLRSLAGFKREELKESR